MVLGKLPVLGGGGLTNLNNGRIGATALAVGAGAVI